jgi:Deoxyribonuclease II
MRTNRICIALVSALALSILLTICPAYAPISEPAAPQSSPVPLLSSGHPVDWWFVFKLNSAKFPDCGGAKRGCPFGGTVQKYKDGQQYVFASSESSTLTQGSGCAGDTGTDPIGATFEQVHNGSFHYLVWNDQFKDDPKIKGCKMQCGGPWGHSKGMLAWNDAGNGFVMQVTTPSWPGAGSKKNPRAKDGNTLGCVIDDNVMVSQHFFALKLNKDDLIEVLKALQNASVVTDPTNPQIVSNGGPSDVQELVAGLGTKSKNTAFATFTLSSGVELISKPSNLNVPPWQMVSSILGGIDLRTATWWATPFIPTTTASKAVKCWDASLSKPGAVQIATTGSWNGQTIGLTGGGSPDHNHAKIGVSISGTKNYSIFGDMNQQGKLSGNCKSSQNGRGGLFYVIDNKELSDGVTALINGKTASTKIPKPKTPKKSAAKKKAA